MLTLGLALTSELPLWRDGKELPDVEAENCGRVGAEPCRGRVIGCCIGGPGPFKAAMAFATVLLRRGCATVSSSNSPWLISSSMLMILPASCGVSLTNLTTCGKRRSASISLLVARSDSCLFDSATCAAAAVAEAPMGADAAAVAMMMGAAAGVAAALMSASAGAAVALRGAAAGAAVALKSAGEGAAVALKSAGAGAAAVL